MVKTMLLLFSFEVFVFQKGGFFSHIFVGWFHFLFNESLLHHLPVFLLGTFSFSYQFWGTFCTFYMCWKYFATQYLPRCEIILMSF